MIFWVRMVFFLQRKILLRRQKHTYIERCVIKISRTQSWSCMRTSLLMSCSCKLSCFKQWIWQSYKIWAARDINLADLINLSWKVRAGSRLCIIKFFFCCWLINYFILFLFKIQHCWMYIVEVSEREAVPVIFQEYGSINNNNSSQ